MRSLRRLVIGTMIGALLSSPIVTAAVVVPAQRAAAAATPVTVEQPQLIRATGALLQWGRAALPAGATWTSYEVHRSRTTGFTPSATTRIATYTDLGRTFHQDRTAAPGTAWYYRVVTNLVEAGTPTSATSAQVATTTPAVGSATVALQPGPAAGRGTIIGKDLSTPAACYTANNWGANSTLQAGARADGVVFRSLLAFDLRRIPAGATVTAATLKLTETAQTATYTAPAVSIHRLLRPFAEGTENGTCGGTGASWVEASNGTRWTAAGGDVAGSPHSLPSGSHVAATTRSINVLGSVSPWVAGTAPNHGFLLKATTEPTAPPAANSLAIFYSDDYATVPSYRPRLEVTFTDTAAPAPARVAVGTPGDGTTVSGTVNLTGAATDDGAVTKMEFLVDGVLKGSDTTAPFALAWDSTTATRGAHKVAVRATDDAGLVTTSAERTFTVDNQGPPAGTFPAIVSPVAGTRSIYATATDDVGLDRVEFVVDGTAVGTVTTPATGTSNYHFSWNTLHPLHGVADGSHTIEAHAVDVAGKRTLLGAQVLTVQNVGADSMYSAGMWLNDPFTSADDAWPPLTTDNTDSGAISNPPNLYDGTESSDGLWRSSTTSGSSLDSAPKDSTSGMTSPVKGSTGEDYDMPSPTSSTESSSSTDSSSTSASSDSAGTAQERELGGGVGWVPPPAVDCPEDAYCPAVTVTNTSGGTWKPNTVQLWYRWFAPNGAVAFEGPAASAFTNSFPRDKTKSFRLVVYPPVLPPGDELGQYNLRIDLYDMEAGVWFSAKGNKSLQNPVIVAKALKKHLGFEKFWTYAGGQTGAGSITATNVSNGNLLWRWSPWTSPGRGLATVLDLTYNSMEDHSRSPVGESFSLAISGLSRLGEPIEIHPNKADQISSKAKKYIEFVDGDGTVHRFDGQADGSWTRPPGVHLYLRSITTDTAAPRYWAISRPDGVTFHYDYEGYPTAVTDRNGNTITFVLQSTPPGEDPGGPKKRVIAVRDAAGRDFTITYLSKAEEKNGRVRGSVKRITDHNGSALDFEYYTDGNLRKVIQRGGVGDDGAWTPDRQFVFTYTTSSGSGPAIPLAANRVDPAPRTPNQSTKLFGIRDPRGAETTFTYYSASDSAKLRWWVKTRTDRATTDGAATSTFAYDIVNRVSTVKDGLGKPTTYVYDTQGRATRITNAKGEATAYRWTADNHVDQITEPNGAAQTFLYDARGYLTQRTNQEAETTRLTYQQQKILSTDTTPWLQKLMTVEQPLGVASATVGDYTTSFTYDAAGNVATQKDPEGGVTTYSWNQAGSAAPGTLAWVEDPLQNRTTLEAYDANGQPTAVRDAGGGLTTFGYTVDGLLQWVQTPLHQTPPTGLTPRAYRTYTDYDAFHRAVRSSTPKSTALEPGVLVWGGQTYDANNNVTGQRSPSFGVGEPGNAPVGLVDFDQMDRPVKVTSPDTADGSEVTVKDYDLIGRLATETAPKGFDSTDAGDFTASYTYDAVDRLVSTKRQGAVGEAPRVSWLCYDNVGNRVASIQPKAGLSAAPTTCPTTPQPWTLLMKYDKAHRTIGSTDATGRTTSQEYDDNGRVRRAVNEAGTAQTFAYDQRGLVTEQVNQVSATRTTTARMRYDAAGRLVKEISPRAVDLGTETDHVTTHAYDKLGREITKALPKDATTEAAYEHTVYDANGRVVTKTLPIASATLPPDLSTNAKATYGYYDTGWIFSSQQAGTPAVLFDYTPEGWQSERAPRESTAAGAPRNESLLMTWQYFADGQIRSRMDEHGLPITFTYDQNNNLVRGVVTSGVVDPSARPTQTTASYNGFDQVVRAGETELLDTVASRVEDYTTYGYDIHGLLVSRGDLGKAGAVTQAVKRNEFQYDGLDRLSVQWELGTATTCTDDRRISTTWKAEDWLASRTIAKATASCAAERSTDPAAWQDSQVETKTYLLNGDLDSSELKNGSGVVQEQHKLSYEQGGAWVGQRTQDIFKRLTPDAAKSCQTTTCTATWTFNARNQLTRYAAGTGDVWTYKLDEAAQQADNLVRAGNVTSETAPNGTTTSRKYVGNQMTETTSTLSAVSNTTKTIYDDLGRVDCIVKSAGSSADCKTASGASANLITDYSYDYLDRLSSIRSYNASDLRDETIYVSDALDRVVKQTEMHKKVGTERRTVTFAFLGLSEQIASEVTTSTGSMDSTTAAGDDSTKTFSYDAYGQRFRMSDSSRTKNADGTWGAAKVTTATYGTDPHSSVSLLLEDSGTNAGKVKAAYGYTAYGDQDDKLTAGDTNEKKPFNPFRYTGHRYDSGSGTLQTGARRYDPGVTRFLQPDMFKNSVSDRGLTMDPLSQNRYAMASGNPTSFIEFDGHMLIANGGGGGSTSTTPSEPTQSTYKAAGVTSEEYYEAQSVPKEFDIGEKLLDAGLDFIGVNDIKDCISNPSFGSCAMAVANFIPWSKLFKAGKLGKKLFELAGEFMDWRKSREAADALLKRVDEAAAKSDGAATKADNPGTSCKLANSFTADTKVVMADGKRKPIKAIRKGDRVRAVDPATGTVTVRTVTDTIRTQGDKALVVLRLADGGRITATTGHPMWEADTQRWVEAGQLKTGDVLRTEGGQLVRVAAVHQQVMSTSVHNISVEVDHTYLVDTGTGTALAHNCETGPAKAGDDAADKGTGADQTAAKANEADSPGGTGAKRGPKPFGTGAHNQKIAEVAGKVKDGKVIAGGQTGRPEAVIQTPGGFKGSRRPDILVERPDGSLYGINVGRQSLRTGAPIKREAEALSDLEAFGGLEMHFVAYNARMP